MRTTEKHQEITKTWLFVYSTAFLAVKMQQYVLHDEH